MSISKKIRFEAFKRDNFKCAYCGRTPPDIVLEADHIEPISKGGTDDLNNLLTACFDCNRGKRDTLLTKIPAKLSENAEILEEKESQIKAYKKLVNKIRLRENNEVAQIEVEFQKYFKRFMFVDSFRVSVRKFIKELTFHEVLDAMTIACGRIKNRDSAIKYFCGICWNKIKAVKNGKN